MEGSWLLVSAANVAKGNRIWKWVGWEERPLERTKKGSVPVCCVGLPYASGLLCSLASQEGPGPLWPLAGRKDPLGDGKAGCSVLSRLPGLAAAVPILCDSVGFVQLSVLVPLQSCCKLGRGKQIRWSRRWTLFITLILWEGSAVQVLWGSNWSAKNKELTCHGARERNEKLNGENGVQMCGRMAVAEISACLRNWLSSCITVSGRDFVEALHLTFSLDEVDKSTRGSFLCPCTSSVGSIAPTLCGRYPAVSRDIVIPQQSLLPSACNGGR